jgi:hypothetical protein
MDSQVKFAYLGRIYRCNVYIDIASDPCFIFVTLSDKPLVNFFGEDITIKTDFERQLKHRSDYDELVELKQAIFDSIRNLPEFVSARKRLSAFRKEQKNKA